MIEAYKIGVTLTLSGDAQRKLEQFTQTSKRAAETIEKLNGHIRPFNNALSKIDAHLQKLNPHMDKLAYAFGDSRKNLTGLNQSFTGFNEKIEAAIGKTEILINKTAKLQREMTALGEASLHSSMGLDAFAGLPVGPRNGSRRGSGGTKGGGRFGVFGFTPGMAVLGLAFAGGYAIKSGYHESNEYQQVMSQIMLQNIPGTSADQINSFINSNSVYGVSKTEMAQKLQDALVVSKNVKEAEAITPFLSQVYFGNKANFAGKRQAFNDNDFYAMVKSSELITGSMNVDKLKPVIDEMVRINSATSGQVKPTEWLQFLQKTRGTLRGADPKVMYQLESLVQEYKGAAVGVMVRAFYQHLDAGRLTTAAAMQLDKMGLVKKGFAEYNKIGMLKRIKPGGIIDQKLRDSDLVDWYDKYFMSYFKKNKLSLEQEKMINSIIFTNSDLALVNGLAQQQDKIAKTAVLNAHAAGTAQLVNQGKNNYAGHQLEMSRAYRNMMKEIGDASGTSINHAMDFLGGFFDLSAWIVNKVHKLASMGAQFSAALPTPVSAVETLYRAAAGQAKQSTIDAVPPATGTPVVVHHQTIWDGKVIMQNVTKHMGENAVRWPQTGGNNPNPYISPMLAGYNGK